jgi:hypothetical protein
MNWPTAFAVVGIAASTAVVMWAIMRYGRTEVEVFRNETKEEKKKPDA